MRQFPNLFKNMVADEISITWQPPSKSHKQPLIYHHNQASENIVMIPTAGWYKTKTVL